MSVIVLYFLHSISVLSFYIDVVLTLMGDNNDVMNSIEWNRFETVRRLNFQTKKIFFAVTRTIIIISQYAEYINKSAVTP